MESLGAFADGDWDSLSRMFTDDDLDFTSHFLGQGSSFPPQNNESLFHTLDFLNSNLQYLSQENSYSSSGSSGVFTTPSQESYYFNDSYHHVPVANGVSMSLDVSVVDEKNIGSAINPAFTDIVMGESASVEDQDAAGNDSQAAATSGKQLQLKRIMYDASSAKDKTISDSSSPSVKKKARVSQDVSVQKSKKIVQSRKSQNVDRNGKEEESNTGVDGHSSISYSSEDDNVGSTSETKAAVNSNGKTRASRGTATDPQSLYARKRREKINERLRILQNLVPNGTKVDISTMLEEAVHYVQFLQLQIKLLSSDDMWMYAPIAYNGMDIGLQQKISSLV
ncbi:hypothetical protein UlMin_035371 [Ulmus minor]